MLKISSNIAGVVAENQEVIKKLANPDVMLRTMATTITAVMRTRVHEEGKDSDGNQIGTYSPSYMKVRTGNYGNSAKVTRGPNQGKPKDAGTYSRGKDKGSIRPRYNRTNDTKIIASLTRQMENDLGTNETDPLKTDKGYAIGFKNPHNFSKSQWVQLSTRKTIWELTAGEKEIVQKIADKFTADAIAG